MVALSDFRSSFYGLKLHTQLNIRPLLAATSWIQFSIYKGVQKTENGNIEQMQTYFFFKQYAFYLWKDHLK